MATIKDLEKYLNYEFSSDSQTGEDYKEFQRKYINYLKSICANNYGWELCMVSKNHYEFTAFFRCDTRYIYFSISDVRFEINGWYNDILIRTAYSEKDYTGGRNQYTNLPNLQHSLITLFDKGFAI
ncbi:MAG: hypothetical protein RR247_02715 [Clostridia bacterium]